MEGVHGHRYKEHTITIFTDESHGSCTARFSVSKMTNGTSEAVILPQQYQEAAAQPFKDGFEAIKKINAMIEGWIDNQLTK